MFQGVCTAMVTPFTKDGIINYEMLKKQIDFQISNGVKTLLFLGTTGESSTMSSLEKIQLVKFAIKYINKRTKIIIGSGSNCTATTIKNSKRYEKLGADALLVVTPYYNKCTQKGLVKHYKSIADSVKIPIILYNVPGRTGVNLSANSVKILSEHNNICAIKEASGNIDQIVEISKYINDNFHLYSGDDGIVLPVLSCGGSGVISVASNIIPEKMVEMCECYFNGDIEKSLKMQLNLRDFIKNLFIEVNPIPIKTIMKEEDLDTGILRMPLCEMEEDNKTMLKNSYYKME